MTTIDLKKKLKPLYAASAKAPSMVEVPSLGCVMVDGKGEPGGTVFQEAAGSLYSVAYTLKFTFKKERSIDYPVMPLEGLWHSDSMEHFLAQKREDWKWTLFIVLPDAVARKDVDRAISDVKKKAKFPRFPDVRFEKLKEGRCAQVLHVGPYSTERETIDRLHAFLRERGYRPRGSHHEIYLGDPRRARPEKLKTILRQPVQKA